MQERVAPVGVLAVLVRVPRKREQERKRALEETAVPRMKAWNSGLGVEIDERLVSKSCVWE